MTTYIDPFTCPRCRKKRKVYRSIRTANKKVSTYCPRCGLQVIVVAGPVVDVRPTTKRKVL